MSRIAHILLLMLALLLPLQADAKALSRPIKIIATFSILGEFAKQVGGEQVNVYSLVGPDLTTHDYKPTNADKISVERCDLVISNGLGLEGWMAELLAASKERVDVMQASMGVAERSSHSGGIDPHAWMSVENAMIYVGNIRDKLVALDPINAQYYKDRAGDYIYQLKKLDHWIKIQAGRLPEASRRFVVGHDSFSYFAQAYGFDVIPVQGIEPSALDSASNYPDERARIEKGKVSAFFIQNASHDRVLREMGTLTGGIISGKLYASALSTDKDADTYIGMMRNNVGTLTGVLAMRGADSKK